MSLSAGRNRIERIANNPRGQKTSNGVIRIKAKRHFESAPQSLEERNEFAGTLLPIADRLTLTSPKRTTFSRKPEPVKPNPARKSTLPHAMPPPRASIVADRHPMKPKETNPSSVFRRPMAVTRPNRPTMTVVAEKPRKSSCLLRDAPAVPPPLYQRKPARPSLVPLMSRPSRLTIGGGSRSSPNPLWKK